jgi:Ala-tRNA(Pro) deacylase
MYVVDFLQTRHVWFETFFHRPASSATRLAGCIHVPGWSVAKSVLVKVGDKFVLAVLSATSRVDLGTLGAALQAVPGSLRLATADEIGRIFENCEPGAIPAFGRLYGLRTVVDASLADAGVIIFGTNLRHLGLKMHFRDYEGLEEPLRAEFGRPITFGPAPSPTSPRRRRSLRAG